MAITAGIIHYDGWVSIDLYPDVMKGAIVDYPDDRDWPFEFDYDGEKFAAGEREFQGIEVLDVSFITDYWLNELDKVDLPRVDVPEAGLVDVTIADVLRWARQTYPSRYSNKAAV